MRLQPLPTGLTAPILSHLIEQPPIPWLGIYEPAVVRVRGRAVGIWELLRRLELTLELFIRHTPLQFE